MDLEEGYYWVMEEGIPGWVIGYFDPEIRVWTLAGKNRCHGCWEDDILSVGPMVKGQHEHAIQNPAEDASAE